MSGYAKLFSEILNSSIWDESNETRIIWITMLALADSEGFIRGSTGWLARRARVNVSTVDIALQKFLSPDPSSRTPANDGRRIESTPDGWVILNYVAYRERDGRELSKDPRRVYQREWMKKKRATDKLSTKSQQVSTRVDDCQPSASAYASVPEGECKGGEFKEPTVEEVRLLFDKSGGSQSEADKFWHFYNSKGWLVGKTKMKRVGSAVAGWILRNQDNAPVNTNPTNYLNR